MASEINNYTSDSFLQYAYIVDSSYSIKYVIDTFSDFLWTERYCGYGEFEITIPMKQEVLNNCSTNDYMTIRESDKIMTIDSIKIHSDMENGDTIVITGRGLESLLDRRIILDKSIGTINEDGSSNKINLQIAISTILSSNVINPSNSNRRIPSFSYRSSSNTKITSLTIESFQDRGTTVYDKILAICQDKDLGFRVNAVTGGGFQFELYLGTDRTWDQTAVLPVIFSDSYENLVNSDYLQTEVNHRTIAYVEWDWTSERTATVRDEEHDYEYETTERESGTDVTEVYRGSNSSGLSRRETFVRDSGVHDIGPDKNKTAAIAQAQDKGKEFLSDYKTTVYFEGETNPYRQFVYGKDYFVGDIVQLENKYGKTGKCRITEIAFSHDSSGSNLIPTFETI